MTKPAHILCFLGLCASAALAADDRDPLFTTLFERRSGNHNKTDPGLDLKRIVNESNAFLKEREPEITGEEFALYEKVVAMLDINVELGLRMLEGMMDQKVRPSPAFEFVLGNVYSTAGQAELAEKYYRSAVTRFPSFLRAWNNLGILYYSAARYAEAVDCFSTAVGLGERDPDTLGLLGYCLEKQGKLVPAETAYLQAAAADPNNAAWSEGLMRLYVEGKQFGRAESLLNALIDEHPDEKRYWLTLASVLVSQGKKIEATVLLETAAGAGLAGPDELSLLADLFAEQQLVPEALHVYRQVLAAAPERGEEKLLQYIRVLIAADQLAEAEQALALLEQSASSASQTGLLQARADFFLAREDWPHARTAAEALLALAPLDGRALLTLGRTYAQEHDLSRARLAFEAAYRIPETTYRASLELAGIELRNRHFAKSAEYLEKALSIQRTDTVEHYLARVKALIPAASDSSG